MGSGSQSQANTVRDAESVSIAVRFHSASVRKEAANKADVPARWISVARIKATVGKRCFIERDGVQPLLARASVANLLSCFIQLSVRIEMASGSLQRLLRSF